ncbi:hypothetical protein RhiirA5_430201 [Rhizophagus irregularis]|uniref:Uncharacterized protein n=2 Tax=Rhizophagus irregularis TaxID=588596 RepID=A0A2N0NX57_9GLOM|nr:hypothetical protein RhiirA5_430201 [Rhizophagus irregularis]PKC70252.1 hypothetical protein RhiirA1_455026 [Rhizophagus irregularis]
MSELEKNLACDRQKKEIIDYCQQQDNIKRDAIAKARRDEAALIGTSVKRLDTCHVAAQCLTFTTNIFHENMDDWDVIGSIIEKQIPQYVQGAEAFPSLKQMYEKVIKAFTSGRSYSWRFKNLGLVDALKAIMSPEKIEAAVFQNLEKVTSSAVYSAADKVANALRFGVKVGGKPVEIGIELIATEMGVAAQVEGVSAVESAIIGITEEEAASVLAVLLVG